MIPAFFMEEFKMLKFILFALIIFLVLFIYSACVISSRCAKEEEERNE